MSVTTEDATEWTLELESIGYDSCHRIAVLADGQKKFTEGVSIDTPGDVQRFVKKCKDDCPGMSSEAIQNQITEWLDDWTARKIAPPAITIDDLPPHVDPSEIEAEAKRQIEAEEPKKEHSEPYFKPITAAELDAGDFSLNYLVHGIVCEKQPVILAGQFKTLKTSVALDLAVSIASGTSFLNQFKVEQRSTMVLTAESGFGTVQETCRRICRSRGFNLGDVPDLRFCDRVPRLENASHIAELAAIMKDAGVKVLVADPAYLMIEGSEAGNLFSMGEQLRIFADLASQAEATPVLLHHAKKNNTNAIDYQRLELGDIAWAGFAEFARQWILLSRRERYVEGSGDHRLWMSVGGSAGHNGCWGLDIAEGHPDDIGGRRWDVDIADAEQAKESAAERNEQAKEAQKQKTIAKNARKLQDAFIGVGRNGITQSDAFAKAGLNASAGRSAMGHLLTEGIIESCDVMKGNGRTYDGYRLTTKAIEETQSDDGEGDLFDGQ